MNKRKFQCKLDEFFIKKSKSDQTHATDDIKNLQASIGNSSSSIGEYTWTF